MAVPSAVCQLKITSLAAGFDSATVNDAVPPSVTLTVAGSNASVAVSSSVIVALAVAVPTLTPLGRLLPVSVTVNVSSPSTTPSPVVGTSSVADLLPAAIVTMAAVACAV